MSYKCEEEIISCKNKVFNQEVKIAIPIYIFEFWDNGKYYSFTTYKFKHFLRKQLEMINIEIINQVAKIKEEFKYDSYKDKGTLCPFDYIILNKIQTYLTKQYGFVVIASGTCGYVN